MALAIGNLLDTGRAKHRFNAIFLHLFYPLKPDLHPNFATSIFKRRKKRK